MPGLLQTAANPFAQANRANGLLTAQSPQQPQAPMGMPSQGGMSPQANSALFATMARYANDPTEVGLAYAAQQQEQQKLNDPVDKFLRLYGTINPRDFTSESISKFHNKFVQDGTLNFDLLQRADELSSTEQQILDDATTQAGKLESQLASISKLQQGFERLASEGTQAGYLGRAGEFFKKALGTEDPITLLRKEFEQLNMTGAINNLPPGVASDKDIELVMSPLPQSTSNPAYIAAYLRGLKKIRAIDLARLRYKSRYMSLPNQTGGYGLEGFENAWQTNREDLALDALRQYGGVNKLDYDTYWRTYMGQATPAQDNGAPNGLQQQERANDNVFGLQRPSK